MHVQIYKRGGGPCYPLSKIQLYSHSKIVLVTPPFPSRSNIYFLFRYNKILVTFKLYAINCSEKLKRLDKNMLKYDLVNFHKTF